MPLNLSIALEITNALEIIIALDIIIICRAGGRLGAALRGSADGGLGPPLPDAASAGRLRGGRFQQGAVPTGVRLHCIILRSSSVTPFTESLRA